jgi:hypothetical protein
VLLTGDKNLRRAAEKENVDVHGLLWLMDRMVEYHILPPSKAVKSLRLIIDKGSRLPCNEVNRRTKRWINK